MKKDWKMVTQKKKRSKKNKKKTHAKFLLSLVGSFFLGAGCFVSLKFDSLLLSLYLATIGAVLLFPMMKTNYDDFQNGEGSGIDLVRFLGFFVATVIAILFCIVLTIFTIRDVLGGSR